MSGDFSVLPVPRSSPSDHPPLQTVRKTDGQLYHNEISFLTHFFKFVYKMKDNQQFDNMFRLMWAIITSTVTTAVLISFICSLYTTFGPGSSVGIATDYGLDGPGSNSGGDEIFRPSRPALGPTQPPVKWVQGLSRGWSAAGAFCWPLTPF